MKARSMVLMLGTIVAGPVSHAQAASEPPAQIIDFRPLSELGDLLSPIPDAARVLQIHGRNFALLTGARNMSVAVPHRKSKMRALKSYY